MQEVFGKIIEKLESLKTPCELGMIENGRYILRDKAIEIVKQTAAEHNESLMKELLEAKKHCGEDSDCSECIFGQVNDRCYLQELQIGNRNGWIPCSERLPEEKINPITDDFYMYPVMYKNQDITDIKYFHFGDGHWQHGLMIMDNYVTHWMDIKPYNQKFIQECANPVSQEEREELNKKIRSIPVCTYQTNADRIRSMSDEELAMNMMCPNENGLGEIECDKSDNCNCYECLLKWLQSEVEE